MLTLLTKNIDIYALSKLLVKYKIQACTEGNYIHVTSDISDELIDKLCEVITITEIRNYKPNSTSHTNNTIESYHTQITSIKRGDVYMCDFGETTGSEQNGIRPAIIIQNDVGNKHSPTTIVLPLTTKLKHSLPTHFRFIFSDSNMINYSPDVGLRPGYILALGEQITTIARTKLLKYMGTMTPEFMDSLNNIICVSLNLEKAYLLPTKSTYNNDSINTTIKSTNSSPLNEVQKKILEFADLSILKSICLSEFNDIIKLRKLIQAFGFDVTKHGIDLLIKAVFVSIGLQNYTIASLSQAIYEFDQMIPASEISRLIIARVKERFNFRNSPTSEFIKLLNSLIKTKGAILDE